MWLSCNFVLSIFEACKFLVLQLSQMFVFLVWVHSSCVVCNVWDIIGSCLNITSCFFKWTKHFFSSLLLQKCLARLDLTNKLNIFEIFLTITRKYSPLHKIFFVADWILEIAHILHSHHSVTSKRIFLVRKLAKNISSNISPFKCEELLSDSNSNESMYILMTRRKLEWESILFSIYF